MDIKKRIENAKVKLLLDYPFFGSILCKHPVEETDAVPTAAVTFDGHILYNPKFVEKLAPAELVFLFAHEVMHVALAHHARRGLRDPEVWNYANDAVINDMLTHDNVGKMIEGGFIIDGAREKTSEQVYDELMKQKQKQKGGGLGGSKGLVVDDLMHDKGNHSQEECDEAIADAKSEAAEASQQARMMGKLSAGLERSLGVFINSKVPWWQTLERFMVGHSQQHQSWNRPNKRYLRTAYLPRRERLPSMGPIIIGVDTSGSITSEDLAKYFGHLNAIIEQCHPESVTVLYTDAKVCAVDEYMPEDYPLEPRKKVPGGGGTDMCEVINWAKKNGVEPDVCLIMTDGYTPTPRADEVPFPLIWLCTTDAFKRYKDVPGEVIFDEGES